MPFFPFYARDWLSSSSVSALTRAEKGAYIDLLARMWEHSEDSDGCYLPADDTYISRILQATPREWKALRVALIDGPSAVFRVEGDRLINPRLSKEWAKARKTSTKRADAARMRWDSTPESEAVRVDSKTHANGHANALQVDETCNANHILTTDADADAEKETPLPPSVVAGAVGAAPPPVETGLPLTGGDEPKNGRPKRKTTPQDPEIKALVDACYEAVVESTGNKPADGGWWGTVYGRTKKLAPDARVELVAAMAFAAHPERPSFMATWVAQAELPEIVTAYRNRSRNGLRVVQPGRAAPTDEGVWGRRIDTPEMVAALQAEAARKGEQAW